jgi:hypothetical protein
MAMSFPNIGSFRKMIVVVGMRISNAVSWVHDCRQETGRAACEAALFCLERW